MIKTKGNKTSEIQSRLQKAIIKTFFINEMVSFSDCSSYSIDFVVSVKIGLIFRRVDVLSSLDNLISLFCSIPSN